MNLHPLIYCPPGVAKPAFCQDPGGAAIVHGKGPDGDAAPAGDGKLYNGPLPAPGIGSWARSPAGWWAHWNGQRPQNLGRMRRHPAILFWHTIPGAQPDHVWRVPALIMPVISDIGTIYVSALDRAWNGSDWQAPSDLQSILDPLMMLAGGQHLRVAEDARNQAIRELAMALLGLGHQVDADLIACAPGGWLSESLMVTVIAAAMRKPPEGA